MSKICILGTLDTKGIEFQFLKQEVERLGVKTLVIDSSPNDRPFFKPDIPAGTVAEAAGVSLEELQAHYDRERVQTVMGTGAAVLVSELAERGEIQGFLSMGGSQGANIAASVMRKLPFGFPKLLISTQVCVEKRQTYFEGCLDMFGVNPTTDVAGLNSIMQLTMRNAAAAMAGMASHYVEAKSESRVNKPRVGITMLGVTDPCVSRIEKYLEQDGYEPLVFHATGFGGNAMERMIRNGDIQAVIDITPTELGHQYVGHGNASCGGTPRLTAAAEMGIPQIVAPGGLDLINFMGEVPKEFSDRVINPLNKKAFAVRTSAEENTAFGELIASRLRQTRGEAAVILPLRGLSRFDSKDGVFWAPEIDAKLFDSLRKNLTENVQLVECDAHINDAAFAVAVYELFRKLVHKDNF